VSNGPQNVLSKRMASPVEVVVVVTVAPTSGLTVVPVITSAHLYQNSESSSVFSPPAFLSVGALSQSLHLLFLQLNAWQAAKSKHSDAQRSLPFARLPVEPRNLRRPCRGTAFSIRQNFSIAVWSIVSVLEVALVTVKSVAVVVVVPVADVDVAVAVVLVSVAVVLVSVAVVDVAVAVVDVSVAVVLVPVAVVDVAVVVVAVAVVLVSVEVVLVSVAVVLVTVDVSVNTDVTVAVVEVTVAVVDVAEVVLVLSTTR